MATFPPLNTFLSEYARQNAVSRLSPERRPAPAVPAPDAPELTASQRLQRSRDRLTVAETAPATTPEESQEEYQYDTSGEVVTAVNTQAALGRRLNITI